MVNDPSTDGMIQWGPDGTTFLVHRHEDFARDVLPRFFKHNNFASFVRQLNMYGFHKIPHLQQGVLQTDGLPEMWEFANPNFQRDQPDLLCLVSRKRKGEQEEKDGSATSAAGAALAAANSTNLQQQKNQQQQQQQQQQAALDVGFIISEIAAIKRHQLSISSDLKSIQRENQVLWTESVAVRERHQRQQETIDKILRFLSSIFSQKQKPLMNKRRRLLLEQGGTNGENSKAKGTSGTGGGGGGGGASSQDSSEDEGDLDADNALQRIQDLMQDSSQTSSPQPQSPFGHHLKLLKSGPANQAESSSTSSPVLMPEATPAEPALSSFLPYTLPHQQLSNSPAYDAATQNAHAVADDIDLLQDHISSLVGLDLDDVGSLDVSALGAALAAQQQLLQQQQSEAGIKSEPLSAADLAMLQQYNLGAFDFSLYPGLNNTTPILGSADPTASGASLPSAYSNADLSNALALFSQGNALQQLEAPPTTKSNESFQERVAATFASPPPPQPSPSAPPPSIDLQQPHAGTSMSSTLSDADIDDLLRVGNASGAAYSSDDLAGLDPEDFAFLDQSTK
ncbi:stress-responsive transcription factor hsf1 [Geranomyces michiganensis]|nr:stress-responsive transcription factor hsf1 [Geranomyces michiganensis]